MQKSERISAASLFVSVLNLGCIVGYLIWLGTSRPDGLAGDSGMTPSPDCISTSPSGDSWLRGDLEVNKADGTFKLTANGDGLSGTFSDVSASVALSNCSKTANELCLSNSHGYKLVIQPYTGSHNDGSSTSCYNVQQSYPLSSNRSNITTCFNYGNHHWYGAAEVHDQHWPIEKWNIDLQEFVTRDPYYPGYYGSVQERYWLSSVGVAIHVPFKIPLFVSMNSKNDGQLCFVSRFQNSVYQNIDKEDLKLTFDMCMSANITSLHTLMADRFWSRPDGRPNLDTLIKPIWSTWAIYKKDINASSLKQYADRILDNFLPISQLEIDDDWTPHYGDWEFSVDKFPNAVETITQLKQKVPAISLWIHPFINVDSEAFQFTADHDMLMKVVNNGKPTKIPGLTTWWNPGYAGLIDFSFDNATRWFLGKLENLKSNYSVDSFKFDAGEIVWMPSHSAMYQPYFHPSEYIKYYVQMAVDADKTGRRQEVRVGCLTQNAPILVRMLDRRSRWGVDNGLKTVIPTALTFGLLGYPFVLPDMIGGNAYEGVEVELELYIRWLQVNIFLPAIQFSIPPWYFNNSRVVEYTREMLNIRDSTRSLFDRLSNESVEYGWPMTRPLWWISPSDTNSLSIDDEFLLGNDLLVAPVVTKGATKRDIYLPTGRWRDMLNNRELEGGQWYRDFDADLWQLPYFARI